MLKLSIHKKNMAANLSTIKLLEIQFNSTNNHLLPYLFSVPNKQSKTYSNSVIALPKNLALNELLFAVNWTTRRMIEAYYRPFTNSTLTNFLRV